MSIDKSGKWWVGTVSGDIDEYLQAYSVDGHKTSQFRLAKCDCGSETFHLLRR
jgi:hypothetical protein